MHPKLTARESAARVSSIAYAPPPPPGHSYVVTGEATDLRPVTRSPYASALTAELHGDVLYAHPTEHRPLVGRPPETYLSTTDPADAAAYCASLPAWHRPDPTNPPTPVPIPRAPLADTNPAYIRAERDNPTGRWFKLPHRTTSVAHYRKQYGTDPKNPHAPIFRVRKKDIYAQFPTSTPADPPPLPESAYQNPERDGRQRPRDRVENPGTLHAYLFTYAPRRTGPTLPLRNDVLSTGSLYIQFPVAEFPPAPDTKEGRYVFQFCRGVLLHEDTPTEALTERIDALSAYRYQPVRVERQERKQPLDNPPGQA